MKLPETIQTILFDLDNTLIDRNAAINLAIRDWLKKQNTVLEKETDAVMDLILQKDNSGYTDTQLFCNWLIANYGNEHTKNGMSSPEVLRGIQEIAISYMRPNATLLNLLQQLKKRYTLLVASNGSQYVQLKKIRQSNLHEVFLPEQIYISEALGYSKPQPEFFAQILSSVKQNPEQCLMVGDHYLNDIEAAKREGIFTCWITKEKITSNNTADITFTEISDIKQWIEE